jgi:NAD(P)-dependent dehydrogenase (short-subunit alcohol dehydrogenase family)
MSGKHALITGNSRGIGRGIALKLAEAGATIAIHYYQNEAAAKETLRMIRERGADGAIFQADVTKPDQIERLFKEVRSRFPSLDIFVRASAPRAMLKIIPSSSPSPRGRRDGFLKLRFILCAVSRGA